MYLLTTKPETIILNIKELTNQNHSNSFLEFNDWLLDDEDSSVRNASNYLMILRLFSVEVSEKELSEITKEDVIKFLDKRKKSLEVDPEKKWVRTWNDYLNRLIGFYRWFANHETSKDRDDWKTPEPFNRIKKKKIKRDSSYTPNDVWYIDELLLAVKYCDNIRDKAIFTIGWDMVSRNHEIVKIKIKDIVIKEKYAEISTAWDTKTGIRTCPVIVGFPYLRELLNIHPFASESNSFLMLSRTTSKPLKPDSLWDIANVLKKKIALMIKEDQIKGEDKDKLVKLLQKPWNPYLMTRHSSITEKSDVLNDFQLKQYAGWTLNSNRARTYVHRKGKQIINPLLEEHGIIEKQERKPVRKECSKCGYINTTEATLCTKCSFVLDSRAWQQTKLEEEQDKKDLNLTISALKQKIDNMEQNQKDEQFRFEQYLEFREKKKKQELEDEILRREHSKKINPND